jgi:hypothetical protein
METIRNEFGVPIELAHLKERAEHKVLTESLKNEIISFKDAEIPIGERVLIYVTHQAKVPNERAFWVKANEVEDNKITGLIIGGGSNSAHHLRNGDIISFTKECILSIGDNNLSNR